MNALMVTILSLSLSGSIFIAILFLCKPLFKERASKRWQYYIWLIIIIRLLLPFSFEVNFIGNLFNEIGYIYTRVLTEVAQVINDSSGETPSIASEQTEPYSIQDIHNVQYSVTYPQTSIWGTLLSSLWLIWLMVAIVLFIRKVTIYQSFVRYIKAGLTPVDDIEDLERFGKIVEQSAIRGTVEFYTNSLISSPLLIGFFRPYIILPTLNISESDFRYTVLHELTHYRRGDMFYKWLVQFTICLHWFNPLVYLMGDEINNACEFSCDESVIKNLDYHGMRAYGDTLLNALGFGGEYKSSISSITLSENMKMVKERLDMITKFRKKSRPAIAITFLATMFLSMGVTVAGAYTNHSSTAVDYIAVSGDNPNSLIYPDIPININPENADIQIIRLNTTEIDMYTHIFIADLQIGDKVTYDIIHDDMYLNVIVANSRYADSMYHVSYISPQRRYISRGDVTVRSEHGRYLLIFVSGTGKAITGTIVIERNSDEETFEESIF